MYQNKNNLEISKNENNSFSFNGKEYKTQASAKRALTIQNKRAKKIDEDVEYLQKL